MARIAGREMLKVGLITGSGGRLGGALARRLAPDHNLILAYRRRRPDVASQGDRPVLAAGWLTGDLREIDAPAGGAAHVVQADLTDQGDIARLVEVGMARFGQIDFIVNAAADTKFHGPLLGDDQVYESATAQLVTNCIAPLVLCSQVFRAAWRDTARENELRNRSVVNVSSISSVGSNEPSAVFYAASKAALDRLTSRLAEDFRPYRIRVNSVNPGRFSAESGTARVVDAVCAQLNGSMTGELNFFSN